MSERTPEMFVDDMLGHGRDWIAILAVARFARNGRWYDEIKSMLQARGLMPLDEKLILEAREKALKNAVPRNDGLDLPSNITFGRAKPKEKQGPI